MFPVAVGGLRYDEIRAFQNGRIFHDRLLRLPYIAGKNHRCLFPVFLYLQPDHRAAQDMPRHPEFRRHTGNNFKGFLKIMDIKMLQRNIGIVYREQRKNLGFARAQSLPVCIFRIGFLDMGAVGQQDCTKLLCRFRTMHAAFKPFFYQSGNQSAVIHMGMGQNHGFDFCRIKRKRSFIKIFNGFGTLEHAAVNQHLPAADFQQVTGSCYSPGRA